MKMHMKTENEDTHEDRKVEAHGSRKTIQRKAVRGKSARAA